MGAGASSADVAARVAEASPSDVAAAIAALSAEERSKVRAALNSNDAEGKLTELVATSTPASSRKYFDVYELLASVESGAIAPLRGRWVVELEARGGKLQRRQDLPPEAFWSADELRRVALALGDAFGVLFVALSYRWLSRAHPDPDGFHLKIVAAVAGLYLNLAGHNGGSEFPSALTQAFTSHGLGEADFALFWDFASLHQEPRVGEQSSLFKLGLQSSNVWYGHERSVCWMQSELPAGFGGVAYDASGWCFVEAAISAAVKPSVQRLDLGLRTDRAMGCVYGHKSIVPDAQLTHVCMRGRLPPPTPEKVERLLRTEKTFTNSSDVAKVAALYAAFFDEVVRATELHFRAVGWTVAEAAELCEALPRFRALTSLDVSENKLGDAGVSVICQAVQSNKEIKLASLNVSRNEIGPEGAKAVAAMAAVAASLTEVRQARASHSHFHTHRLLVAPLDR